MMNFKDWFEKIAVSFVFNSVHRKSYWESFSNRIVLYNTFWGFDHPVMTPPNFIVTGPLFK